MGILLNVAIPDVEILAVLLFRKYLNLFARWHIVYGLRDAEFQDS